MQIQGLPEGFKEGPFAFERNGKYYFTFPWVKEKRKFWLMRWETIPWVPLSSRVSLWMNHQPIAGPITTHWWNTKTSGTCSITTTITPPNSIKTDRHESIPYSSTRTALSKSNPHPARSGHNRCPERNSTGSLQPVKQSGSSHRLPEPGKQIRRLENLIEQNGAWVQYNRVNFGDSTPGNESKSNLGQRRNTANTYKRNKRSGYLGNKSSQNR